MVIFSLKSRLGSVAWSLVILGIRKFKHLQLRNLLIIVKDLKLRLVELVGDDVIHHNTLHNIYLLLTYLSCPIFLVELIIYMYIW